jgi:hypothetical protein
VPGGGVRVLVRRSRKILAEKVDLNKELKKEKE